MKIQDIQACTVSIPLETPVAFSTRNLTKREYTLVKVTSDTGVQGIGFCYAGTNGGRLCTLVVRDLLQRTLQGRDPHNVESLWEHLYQETLLLGRRGVVLRALSALDIALWDLIAKDAGVPLYQLLGGAESDAVPAYASGGYYGTDKTVEDLVEEVRKYVRRGFSHVKIKMGRESWPEELKRLRAVREAIGYDVELFLDANNAWSTPQEAIRRIRELEEFAPGWVEEPLRPDDVQGHARVRAAVDPPVATGEIEATRWGFQPLMDYEAADVLQPDAAVVGGITEWKKIASAAASHSLSIAPHWFSELHVHLVASTSHATLVEYFPTTSILNIGRLFQSRLNVRDGRLLLPQAPGLGVSLDQEEVERFTVDGWG